MTREWPADDQPSGSHRPSPWPIAFLLLTGALVAIALRDPDPLHLLAAAVVTYALLSVVADVLRRSEARFNARGESLLPRRFGRGTRAQVVLITSVTAIREGEDPRAVAERLRDVPVEGRARLCRDVAVRCLEGAARYRQVEGRLKREATGWIEIAFKEMK